MENLGQYLEESPVCCLATTCQLDLPEDFKRRILFCETGEDEVRRSGERRPAIRGSLYCVRGRYGWEKDRKIRWWVEESYKKCAASQEPMRYQHSSALSASGRSLASEEGWQHERCTAQGGHSTFITRPARFRGCILGRASFGCSGNRQDKGAR